MAEQSESRAEIGRRRGQMREAKGLTQEQLAVAAGVTAKTIGKAEDGGFLRETNVRAIAEALGVEARDYFEPPVYAAGAVPVPAEARP